MIGVLVVGHAPLASALESVATHVYGVIPALQACDIDSDAMASEQQAHILRACADLMTSEILICVDVLGATPANALTQSMESLKAFDYRIVTGVNLPMLLRVLAYRGTHNLDQLVNIAIEGGTKAIHEGL